MKNLKKQESPWKGLSMPPSSKMFKFVWLSAWLILYGIAGGNSLSRHELSYSEVAALGQSCAAVDSCNIRRSSGSRELDSVQERNCACDYLCDEYGDCCIDAPAFEEPSVFGSSETWKCLELRQFGGVYMKTTCENHTWNPELVDLCENSKFGDFSDPLGAMPATDFATGLTYKNYYCGLCNKDSDKGLVLWTPRLECPSLTFYNESRRNLTHDYVFQNLIFDGNNWGLYLDGDNGSLFFHDCVIDPVMPRLLESKIRLCKTQSISECPESWKDESVKAKCSAYTGLRYYHSEKYRNVHCALCNGVNISLLTCQSVEYREMLVFRTFEHRAFSLLLDINENKGPDVGFVQKCNAGEVFDPFFKKCRSLTCLPGHIRQGNKCVPDARLTSTTSTTENPDVPDIFVGNDTNVLDTDVKERNASYDVSDEHNDSTKPETVKPVDRPTKMRDFENLTGISYNTSMLDEDSQLENEIGKFKDCLLITLKTGDYMMFENKTIYVREYDRLYEPTKYFSMDGSVLVCSHLEPESHFSPVMGYVTYVGLGISMFCLFLHFLVFCIVPDLRNLSGRNLVSQCVALFNAYLCFMLSQVNRLAGTPSCVAAAFFTVFFFQASFFWMNTMAYDVWRTLRMATTELRVSVGRQSKRFLLYSLYSWLMPLLVICVAAVAEYTELFPEEYRPRFAQPRCWFRSRRALLSFFAAPLFAIVISNVFLFVSSAKMIILTTKKTTAKQQSASQRRNFKLYLRLAILMGLTWGVGLVAGYAELEALWYLFIVLNTLQGLFVFVAFSCSTKVLNHLRDYVTKYTKAADLGRASALHSTTSNSGCNSNSTTALTSIFSKSSSKLLVSKKHSASPTHSSASNCSSRVEASFR